MLNNIKAQLTGTDLRSIGESNTVVTQVTNQPAFDELFACLYNDNRVIVMRAADAIEKITKVNTGFLEGHEKELLKLLHSATKKELKWHLALLIPRIKLTKVERMEVWKLLTSWAVDSHESKIVRVNSIQSLYDLQQKEPSFHQTFNQIAEQLFKENIPSINARLKSLTINGPFDKNKYD